jgi:addiction module HigA family antidote
MFLLGTGLKNLKALGKVSGAFALTISGGYVSDSNQAMLLMSRSLIITKGGYTVKKRQVPYPTPGEILLEEFLKPMGITQYRLAKEIGVSQGRIGEIISGKRAVTTDTGLRLSRFFGLSEGFWERLQIDYDLSVSKAQMAGILNKIIPYHHAAA